MTFPAQKTFGEFVADRYGPKWVYAARATDNLRSRYPDSVVITPKYQDHLRRDYAREWGREYDPAFWQMLCALRHCRNIINPQENSGALTMIDAALSEATKPR